MLGGTMNWASMVQSIAAFCERVQQGLTEATFEQKRHVIELLVDRVVVTGEEVEIRYVIPTSPHSEQVRFCQLRLDYFNTPMSSLQLEQALRDSDRRREACHPIADRLMPFAFGLKAAADLKDAAPDQANRSSP